MAVQGDNIVILLLLGFEKRIVDIILIRRGCGANARESVAGSRAMTNVVAPELDALLSKP